MTDPAASWHEQPYRGFEQGPIRPPSEAGSLLIRVTRNCPWNHCTFCPVYKRRRFSLRPVDHVLRDIDTVARYALQMRSAIDAHGQLSRLMIHDLAEGVPAAETDAFYAAVHWAGQGMASIFLQDANSLVLPPERLIRILSHLSNCFPWVTRITSYARSRTLVKIAPDQLAAMRTNGLSRIHVGMETGSDLVLRRVRKGATQADQIRAGQAVQAAGMELSEYIMPGLGGRALSATHARESATALNQINPDYIRLRTLALPAGIPLTDQWAAGEFEKLSDVETASEIRNFIADLDGITSRIRSDHVLNLFDEVHGTLPKDKPAMLSVLDEFLSWPAEHQMLFQVGRRLGVVRRMADLESHRRRDRVQQICDANHITPTTVDDFITETMKRYI